MIKTAFSPHSEIYINYLRSNQKHNMSVQHYHDAYEIYLQISGKRYLFYDNICYTLEAGDLAIFEPFDIHYAQSREADYYERYIINFRSEIFESILTDEEMYILLEKIKTGVIHLNHEQTKIVYEYFERVQKYSAQHGFLSEKLLYMSALQLIMLVIGNINHESIAKGEKIAPQVIKAIQYIEKNYHQNITLDDIADYVHTSKYYFCRLFHSVTGATVIEYLNNIRLTKVHSLLIETNDTIDKIAQKTGFSSAVNLTRVFKKTYGSSPREFRKNQYIKGKSER